jgi:hypothetical protein
MCGCTRAGTLAEMKYLPISQRANSSERLRAATSAIADMLLVRVSKE